MSKAFSPGSEKTNVCRHYHTVTQTVDRVSPLELDSQIPEGSSSSLRYFLLLTYGHP